MGTTKVLAAILAASCLSDCASIVSQSSWPVTIKSTPDQAKFIIINEKGETIYKGTTPATVALNSGAGYFAGATYQIKFSREGYQDSIVTIDTKLNGWYLANIMFGGIIGLLIVDPATGAMWRLPESIQQELIKINYLGVRSNVTKLMLISLDDVPNYYRSQLIKIKE